MNRIPAALACVALLSSCALRQPAVVTEDYAPALAWPAAGPPGTHSIAVQPFTSAPGSGGQMLLYRADELRYERDFYNRWFASPPRMLTDALRQWLAKANAGEVLEPGSSLAADLVVQPRLDALYADYRDEAKPQAVVAMTMVLVARDASGQCEVLGRSYRREVAMAAVSPEAAVRAWSTGLAGIFSAFTADLRQTAP